MKKKLSPHQIHVLQASERAMSVLSVLGSLFIITTFLRWHFFRKPINRLIFFASFGNIMANVATLISTSALPTDPHHVSGLCEFQGLLIQWFMMADSLWVFCMALNVMLVFFHGYNSRQLRCLEKWYLLFSYGLPGTSAFIYVILDHVGPKQIFGGATIWCWVSSEVEWMRIAFFYGPVWVVVVATLMIYIVTGHQIFKKRAQLRSFAKMADQEAAQTLTNPFTAGGIGNIVVKTEMKVETHSPLDEISDGASPIYSNESRSSFSSTKQLSHVVEAPVNPIPSKPRFSRVMWEAGLQKSVIESTPRKDDEPRNGYQATAFSTYPVQSADFQTPRSTSMSTHNPNQRRTPAMEGNAAAWSYFKVAFLMFAALFIVWVPSTMNRLQQFINREKTIFGLNLASAMVLPLQGFWNSVIYASTTWPECKRALSETLDAIFGGNRTRRRTSTSKESNHTLTVNETTEFESAVPLENVISAPDSERRTPSRMSSAETMRPIVSHPEK